MLDGAHNGTLQQELNLLILLALGGMTLETDSNWANLLFSSPPIPRSATRL